MPSALEIAAIRKRRADVADLLLSGIRNKSEIARRLSIGVSTVASDVRRLSQAWLAEASGDIAIHKARMIAEITRARREAWEAWQASKNPSKRLRSRQAPSGKGEFTETQITLQTGNPQYLAIWSKLIMDEAQLLGIRLDSNAGTADGQVIQAMLAARLMELAERAGLESMGTLAISSSDAAARPDGRDAGNVIDAEFIRRNVEQSNSNGSNDKGKGVA